MLCILCLDVEGYGVWTLSCQDVTEAQCSCQSQNVRQSFIEDYNQYVALPEFYLIISSETGYLATRNSNFTRDPRGFVLPGYCVHLRSY